MRFLLTFFVAICAWSALAQNKKPSPIPEQKPPAGQPQAATVSPQQLMQHFYAKYSTALRWNDAEAAKNALYDIILMNPSNDSIIYSLAYYYYERQQYASALLITQDLLTRSPKNTTFLELAGSSADEIGVQDRALQYYESLYLITNSTETLYRIAFLQYGLKRFEEAKANTEILLTKPELATLKVVYNDAEGKPKEYVMKVPVLNLKGLIALDTGDKDKAKSSFSDALALAADFVPAKQNLDKLK